MPYKDPQKRLAYNSEWRKKNKDKVLQYLQNQKSRKPIKFAKGIDKAHCIICGKEFIKTQVRHKYCTLQCQNKRRNQYPDGYRVKKYKTEDERKTAFKKAHKRYRDSDKGKSTQTKYTELESTQKRLKKYKATDQYKKMMSKHEAKFRKTEKGKEIKRRYIKKRYKVDFNYRLRFAIRSRFHRFMKISGIKKPDTTTKLLGCSFNELARHIEKQFYPHPVTKKLMTWENRSNKTWHIDHIIPLSRLNKNSSNEDIKKICHYSNLQPLWAEENIKKSNK